MGDRWTPGTPSPASRLCQELRSNDTGERRLSISDFDYEDFVSSVNSPGAESISSEPGYIRQPGFEHHAHKFAIQKDRGKPSVSDSAKTSSNQGKYVLASSQSGIRSPSEFHLDESDVESIVSLRGILESDLRVQSFYPSPSATPTSLNSLPSSQSLQSLQSQPIQSGGGVSNNAGYKSPSSLTPISQTPVPISGKSRVGNHSPPGVVTKVSKKKKINTGELPQGSVVVKTSTGSIKSKIKREPLPMKQRALPHSFWLQPNKSGATPPSSSVLPPLLIGKDVIDMIEVHPVSPTDKREGKEQRRVLKAANTDLLFSLFDSIEREDGKNRTRKGRPKKSPSSVTLRSLKDDDPCLVSTATDSILPLLPRRTPGSSGYTSPLETRYPQGLQVLEMLNVAPNDRSLSLPSLNIDQGYSELLSELVLKL